MCVYEKVRSYIDENGIKKKTVAQLTKIPYSTFNEILSGKKTMQIDDLRAICQALKVSPETFVDYQIV